MCALATRSVAATTVDRTTPLSAHGSWAHNTAYRPAAWL